MPFGNGDIVRMPVDDKTGKFGWITLRRSNERDVEDAVDKRLHLRKRFHPADLQ